MSQSLTENFRILVIEDGRDSADSLRMVLELSGHTVAVCYSGADGVHKAKQWRPDIVLCDLGMPDMDGFAVAHELRRHPETADACLIAVTGYGREEDRRKSREVGFDHHMLKPINLSDLERLMPKCRV